ncbi:Tfp pilus assembly protein FimT/FimU [Tychonema sp. BBK16]|uniref:pilus assembly FimT family protein n=1 Tax=Tychonema sp. BBK16 TaxID=2699888 RepID=UPI001F2FA9D2|nr:type II secretion system protein [Tychonema sp. BBK16]MCF6374722.1 type II secretion system GspH family protein [Tychonema sp. BBK16]
MSINKAVKSRANKSTAGFTITELLAIVLVIGIVSAISVPAWQMFINNHRVKTSVDRVYWAMEIAQSNAKRDKISWQVSFKTVGKTVQLAIHKSEIAPAQVPAGEWKSLEPDIKINTDDTTFVLFNEQNEYDKSGGIRRAMFNFQGCPVYKSTDDCGLTSLRAKATFTLSHSDLPNGDRCVIISTLLGHTRIGKKHKKANENGRYCY